MELSTRAKQSLARAVSLQSDSARRTAISTTLSRLGNVGPDDHYPTGFSLAVDQLMNVPPDQLEDEVIRAAERLFPPHD